MKKPSPGFILTSIYLISLVAGFSLAGLCQAKPGAAESLTSRQENWILVRVDDMTLEHPSLVSVWAMFLTFSPEPQIFFKPIFTVDSKQTTVSRLADQFSVSTDRTISASFFNELDRLNLRRSGMVIVDDLGFKTTTEWLNSSMVARPEKPFIPNTSRRPMQALSPEFRAYENMCASLALADTRPQALRWRSIYPGHVIIHPGLANLANIWGRILADGTEAHCEVVSGL